MFKVSHPSYAVFSRHALINLKQQGLFVMEVLQKHHAELLWQLRKVQTSQQATSQCLQAEESNKTD